MKHRTLIASLVAAGTIGAGVAHVTTGPTTADAAGSPGDALVESQMRGDRTDEFVTSATGSDGVTDDAITNAAFADGLLLDAYVPIEPCRLADSRPSSKINKTASTLGPRATQRVNVTNGRCEIPIDATALVANITAIGQTDQTFMTIHPEGTDRPLAATINPTPGLPAYNATTIPLFGDTFNIYNNRGTVDYVIDVTGFYRGSFVPWQPTADEGLVVTIVDRVVDDTFTTIRVEVQNITTEYRYDIVNVWIECSNGEIWGTEVFLIDPGQTITTGVFCDGEDLTASIFEVEV